jgi:hypothetical protein
MKASIVTFVSAVVAASVGITHGQQQQQRHLFQQQDRLHSLVEQYHHYKTMNMRMRTRTLVEGVAVDEGGSKIGNASKKPDSKANKKEASDNMKCDYLTQPYYLYTFDDDQDFPLALQDMGVCASGCDSPEMPLGEIASEAFLTAKECCDEYPEASVPGHCFHADQRCLMDRLVCEEEPFYYYEMDIMGIKIRQCQRMCSIVAGMYYYDGSLPVGNAYATGDECCADHGGCGELDFFAIVQPVLLTDFCKDIIIDEQLQVHDMSMSFPSSFSYDLEDEQLQVHDMSMSFPSSFSYDLDEQLMVHDMSMSFPSSFSYDLENTLMSMSFSY